MLHCEIRRRALKLTQKAVSNLTGINQTFISLMEQGRYNPNDEELSKLSNTLGLLPHELLQPYDTSSPMTPLDPTDKIKLAPRSEISTNDKSSLYPVESPKFRSLYDSLSKDTIKKMSR